MQKPNVQIDDFGNVREMTDEEYEALLATWTMEGTDEIPLADSLTDAG
jgi:hypothetical protein